MLRVSSLFFQEHLTVRHVSDHVLHPIAAGLQLQAVLLQIIQLIVGQAAAGRIGRQVLQDAERHLIDAIFRQISFQIVRCRRLRS